MASEYYEVGDRILCQVCQGYHDLSQVGMWLGYECDAIPEPYREFLRVPRSRGVQTIHSPVRKRSLEEK